MKICTIIPVYNESEHIGQIIESLKKKNLDILVVDDGSTDDSGKIAQAKGAKVIRHETKNGKGYSLQRGFEYILTEDYDGIVTMDGDGQHDPDDIDRIIKKAEEAPLSIVTGNRMENRKDMPLVRILTNAFMSGLISFMCKQKIYDTQCGFRYINCGILRDIRLSCKDYEIETEVLIKASKKGYKVYSVPIKTIYSTECSHIHPVKDTIRFFSYILKETLHLGDK